MTGGRWELLRALGAVADSPAAAMALAGPLGLDRPSTAEHTEVFVLNCPPYASVYLGPDGGLGGEGADRAAGFWRAIGLGPPAEPDHLAALAGLHASLGEAADDTRRPATAAALARTRAALLAEHLWPWLPAYLDAVTDVAGPALAGWARLTLRAITAEYAGCPPPGRLPSAPHAAAPPALPLALRAAPPEPAAEGRVSDLIDALTTPVRSGIILTRRRVALGAGQAGVGHRVGERRFALRAMLEQDPAPTLGWLAGEARRWQLRHSRRAPGDPCCQWWASRAARTATLLRDAAAEAAQLRPTAAPAPSYD